MITEVAAGLLTAFTLPAVPESARTARGRVRAALTAPGLRELADDAEVVVSELVANAVQHAGSPADVALITTAGELIIIIVDSSPVLPTMSTAGDDAESGRGLAIVDAVTGGQWGCWKSSAGKLVWARLGFAALNTGEIAYSTVASSRIGPCPVRSAAPRQRDRRLRLLTACEVFGMTGWRPPGAADR